MAANPWEIESVSPVNQGSSVPVGNDPWEVESIIPESAVLARGPNAGAPAAPVERTKSAFSKIVSDMVGDVLHPRRSILERMGDDVRRNRTTNIPYTGVMSDLMNAQQAGVKPESTGSRFLDGQRQLEEDAGEAVLAGKGLPQPDGVLVQSVKQTAGDLGAIGKTIGKRMQKVGIGAQEQVVDPQYFNARLDYARASVLPEAAREAQEQGISIIDHPDVIGVAETLGIRPDQLATGWIDYANKPKDELDRIAMDSMAKVRELAPVKTGLEGKSRRLTQESAALRPDMEPFSARAIAFDIATSIPELATAVGASAVGGPSAGLAAMAAMVEPVFYTEGKQKFGSAVKALGYAGLMTLAEVVPETPVLSILSGKVKIGNKLAERYLGKAGAELIEGGLAEAPSEALTSVMQSFIESGMAGEDINLKDMTVGTLRDALVGFGMGTAIKGAGMAGRRKEPDEPSDEALDKAAEFARRGVRLIDRFAPKQLAGPPDFEVDSRGTAAKPGQDRPGMRALPAPTPSDAIEVDSEGIARRTTTGEEGLKDAQRAERDELGLPNITRVPLEALESIKVGTATPAQIKQAQQAGMATESGALLPKGRRQIETERTALAKAPKAQHVVPATDQMPAKAIEKPVETPKPQPARVLGQEVESPAGPSEAQAAAGNYRKPVVDWGDMPVRLENLKGSVRRGPVDEATGKPTWETETKAVAYGYISGTKSADKEGIDIYIGDDEQHADKAFVIDQLTPDGKTWDEPKIVTAVPDEAAARALYLSHFPKKWKGLGAITPMTRDQVEVWAYSDAATKPVAWKVNPHEKHADTLNRIAAQSGWYEVGGRAITDEDEVNPKVTGRTKWLAHDDQWREAQQVAPLPKNVTGGATKEAVRKALAGEKLRAAETRHIAAMVEADTKRIAEENAHMERISASLEKIDAAAMDLDELATNLAELERNIAAAEKSEPPGPVMEGQKPYGPTEDMFGAAPPKQKAEPLTRAKLDQLDMFGDKLSAAKQELARLQSILDARRNTGQQSAETGKSDDLFSQSSKQVDVEDVAQPKPKAEEKRQPEASKPEPKQEAAPESRTAGTEEAPPAVQKSSTAITDFGEKLEGARKDYAAKLKDAKSADVASVPLSASWPEPNYQQLLENGADPWAVGFMHAARDEIPTKPQQSWKLRRWVEQVTLLRDVSFKLANGEMEVASAKEKIAANPALKDVANRIELYLAVGHEKSLKGIKITAGSYSMFNRVEYKPSKTIWAVEGNGKSSAMGNWPNMLGHGDTRAEAIAAFKKTWEATTPEQDTKKAVSFALYSRRDSKTYFIAKKIGKNLVTIKDGFTDVKTARAYLQNHHDELVATLEKMKDVPSERRAENAPRVGIDHRNGADVTPEQFQEAFGFRGVQFGNYVEGGRRQADLNETYDALMDMAGVLGIPAKALSLNGELGLAFGARGTGGKLAPKAHYERGNVVINLTKNKGAGSLAHEWFHGLDSYFSRKGGQPNDFMTVFAKAAPGVRPEVFEAFKNIVRAINATDIRKRSQMLDRTRSSPYWATTHEMSARAFEATIIAKLQDQNASNDYLANIVSPAYWEAATALGLEKQNTYPYPLESEMPGIRAAFDKLFSTVEAVQTERGMAINERTAPYISAAIDPRLEGTKVVDKDGNPLRVYHGTGRGDRFVKGIKQGRATSGPMPFFTDDPSVASNYAQGKGDTSMDGDEMHYQQWFLYKPKGGRTEQSIVRMWYELSSEQRAAFNKRMLDIGLDDDGNVIDGGERGGLSPSSFEWELKQKRGNGIEAAIELWLTSGSLYNDEVKFMKVLRLAGLDTSKIDYVPQYSDAFPAVVPVHLGIRNPLDTGNLPDDFVARLEKAVVTTRSSKAAHGVDPWDKDYRYSPKEWVEKLKEEVAAGGNQYAWTSIPDKITEAIAAMGYDGIKDVGGKGGGQSHVVWIPFRRNQVASATGKPNAVFEPSSSYGPLSEKQFYAKYAQHIDIRGRQSGTAQQNIEAIKRDGFRSSFLNVYSAWGGGQPMSITDKAFMPQQGDVVYLVPKDQIKGHKIKSGWKPADNEVVTVEYDGQPLYELYQKASQSSVRESATAYAPLWRSALMDAAQTAKRERGTGKEWLNTLRNMPGVKQDEIEATDLEQFLGDRIKIPKSEVVAYLQSNGVQVTEAMHGGSSTSLAQQEHDRLVVELSAKGYIASPYVSTGDINISDPKGRLWSFDPVEVEWTHPGKSAVAFPDDVQELADQLAELRQEMADVGRRMGGHEHDDDETKYGRYTLPGGKVGTYRELLLTLPAKSVEYGPPELRQNAAGKWAWFYDSRQITGAFSHQSEAERHRPKAIDMERMVDTNYRSSHWSEPNIIAHIRFDERVDADGKKVMHIAEVQSDWHQRGRKSGYRDPSKAAALRKQADAIKASRPSVTTEEGRAAYAEMLRLNLEANQIESLNTVPNAPFKTTWPELAMKRAIRFAAENGFDRITWDTGDTQIERFKLSHWVDYIDYVKSAPDRYNIAVVGKNGEQIVSEDAITIERVEELIGKDAAAKIANGEGQSGGGRKTIRALDIKVGGHGQRGFYDKMLPATVGKLIKKWGGKVGSVTIPYPGTSGAVATQTYSGWGVYDREAGKVVESGLTEQQAIEKAKALTEQQLVGHRVHAFDITDAMRASAMQGMAVFESGNRYSMPKSQISLPLGDPYANITTRPNATEAVLDFGRRAFADAERRIFGTVRPDLWEGATLLGSRINAEYRRQGGIEFVGQSVGTGPDAGKNLAILAQVVRSPEFETSRYFFVDAQGKILASHAYSSGLPGAVFFPKGTYERARADMQRLGATGYFMLHNHPSGSPAPSDADLRSTMESIRLVPGFQGHIIIDHNAYAEITKVDKFDRSVEGRVVDAPWLNGMDLHANPEVPHHLLGAELKNPAAAAATLKGLQTSPDYVTLVSTGGSEGKVNIVIEAPLSSLLKEHYSSMAQRRAVVAIRRALVATGAGGSTFAVLGTAGRTPESDALVSSKAFTEVFDVNGVSLSGAIHPQHILEKIMSTRQKQGQWGPGMREEQSPYGDQLGGEKNDGKKMPGVESLLEERDRIMKEMSRRKAGNDAIRAYRQLAVEKGGGSYKIAIDNLSDREVGILEEAFGKLDQDIAEQRRGKRSWNATEKASLEMLENKFGLTLDSLVNRKLGSTANAETLDAYGSMLVSHVRVLSELAEKAAATNSNEDVINLMKARERMGLLLAPAMGYRSEAGRALNILRKNAVTFEKADQLWEAMGDGSHESLLDFAKRVKGAGSVDQIIGLVRASYTPTMWDKFYEYWINGILSGLKTHAVNITSNAMMNGLDFSAHAIAAMTSSEVSWREVRAAAAATVHGTTLGLANAKRAFITEEPQGDAISRFEMGHRKAIGGKLGKIVRIPGRALMAEDEFFKSVAYHQELARLAMREAVKLNPRNPKPTFDDIMGNLLERQDLVEAARAAALRLTFQTHMGPITAAVARALDKSRVGRLIVPFIRTPTNILKAVAEYSIAAPLLERVRNDFAAGGAPAAVAKARIGIGSGFALAAVGLALNGMLSGNGPDDEEERKLLEKTGWQRYSLKVGDTWVAYNRFDPTGTILGLSADMTEASRYLAKDELDKVGTLLIASIAMNLGEKSYLRGIADFSQAYSDPARYMKNYTENLATSLIPNIVAQTAGEFDPYQREARSILDRAKSKIPGLRQTLPMRHDLSGAPMETTNVGFFLPLSAREVKNDPLAVAMLKLGLGKDVPDRRIRGVELTSVEYQDLVNKMGKARWDELSPLVSTPYFQEIMQSDPEAAREELDAEWNKIGNEIRQDWLDEHPDIGTEADEIKDRPRAIGTRYLDVIGAVPSINTQKDKANFVKQLRDTGNPALASLIESTPKPRSIVLKALNTVSES